MSKELRKANAKTLDQAFKGLLKRVSDGVPSVFRELLDRAVHEAFEIHEEPLCESKKHKQPHPHQIHLTNKHYGWVLMHDGTVMDAKFWDDSTPSTAWVADAVADAVFEMGWVGLLVCDMSPNKPYNWDFEYDVFDALIGHIDYDIRPKLIMAIAR